MIYFKIYRDKSVFISRNARKGKPPCQLFHVIKEIETLFCSDFIVIARLSNEGKRPLGCRPLKECMEAGVGKLFNKKVGAANVFAYVSEITTLSS